MLGSVNETREAVARAQSGDRDAFRDLYLSHHEPLYRYVLGEVRNQDDATEVVQEVFVRAWEAIDSFRGEASFLGWIFRIARNMLIDRSRARKRHPVVSLDAPLGEDPEETRMDRVAGRGAGPEAQAVNAEEQSRFRKALAALPEIQGSVFILREWEGMDYRDIAVRLGINEGTVKSRLARARDSLVAAMREGE